MNSNQSTILPRRLFDGGAIAAWISFAILCVNAYLNLPPSLLLPALILVWIVLFFLPPTLADQFCRNVGASITPGRIISITTVAILFVFFVKFRISSWDMILFNDDYTSGYAASVKYLGTLKQGAMYGWDSSMLGGFCSAADSPQNKSLFLFPFAALLGPAAGYHVMLLIAYCAFPFLCMRYAAHAFKEHWCAPLVFVFASIFLISFFRNFMAFGMTDALLGLDFFVLNLVLYQQVRKGTGVAAFGLTISLALTMYAHVGFLFISVVYITLEMIFDFSRALAIRTLVILGLAFFMTLHNTFIFIRFFHSFNFNPDLYAPERSGLLTHLINSANYYAGMFNPLQSFTARYRLETLGTGLLPIMLFMARGKGTETRKIVIFAASAIAIQGLAPLPVAGILASRIDYTLALTFSLTLSLFIVNQLANRRLYSLVLIPLLLLPTFKTNTYYPFTHIPSLRAVFPAVVEAISHLDDSLILLEGSSHQNAYRSDSGQSQRPILEGHWESLLALETGKRFLTSTMEGYGFAGDRRPLINTGVFQGKRIERASIDTISTQLRKWGVAYVILWSKASIHYFSQFPQYFKPVGSGFPVTIFKYLQADARSLEIAHGEGTVVNHDFFEKRVMLYGCQKGDTAVIRQNFFPLWTAEVDGRRVPVFDRQDQLAVVLPRSGDVIISMRFPKMHVFTVLASFSVLISLIIFIALPRWKRGPRQPV